MLTGDLDASRNVEGSNHLFHMDGADVSDLEFESYEDSTITLTVTKDVFETVTNVIYNSIPVTLTNMVKNTLTLPVSMVSIIQFGDHGVSSASSLLEREMLKQRSISHSDCDHCSGRRCASSHNSSNKNRDYPRH